MIFITWTIIKVSDLLFGWLKRTKGQTKGHKIMKCDVIMDMHANVTAFWFLFSFHAFRYLIRCDLYRSLAVYDIVINASEFPSLDCRRDCKRYSEDWKSNVVLTNLHRERGSSGVWILQRNLIVGTCYESGGKDLQTQNSAAD